MHKSVVDVEERRCGQVRRRSRRGGDGLEVEVGDGGLGTGLAVGLLRPITLYPFPVDELRRLSRRASAFGVVELSTGQLLDDVRLAAGGRAPVDFYSRTGGNVPSTDEVQSFVRTMAERYCSSGDAAHG